MTAPASPAPRQPLSRWLGMACLSTVLVLAGCATPMDPRKDAQYQSYGNAASRPTVRPVRSVSSFSDSLMCMDQMLREANITTTLVTSKLIPDASLRVPVATKEMIITALSQMSRLSNAFRYVDYEVDIARQDTVQNLTTILLNNNQIQLQRPSLYISGAVAFVDQNVLSNRFDAGTSGSRLETGYSRDRNVTVVGLELHLGDFRSRTLIPGMDSANEVIIGTGGQGLDVAGRIGDYGLQFNVGRDYAQGTGAAIRTLVELAMIELVGKWARVPYWQCLTLEQNHPDFQRQLRDWYDEGGDKVHQGLVRRSLVAKGYLPGGDATPPVNSLAFRRALARFQADQRMVVTGTVNFPTYERVLRDFVALDANGQLSRYGWMSQDPTPVQPAEGPDQPVPSSGLAYGQRTPARSIDLQIENVLLGRTVFEVGEQVFLSATVSQASHLSCYLSDSAGNVMRLIPNPHARLEIALEQAGTGRESDALAVLRALAPVLPAAAANVRVLEDRLRAGPAPTVAAEPAQPGNGVTLLGMDNTIVLPGRTVGADEAYALARRFHQGNGVPANYSEAIRLYRQAEAQGNTAARQMLALIYSRPTADGQIDFTWMRQLSQIEPGTAGVGTARASAASPWQREPTPLSDLVPPRWRGQTTGP